MKMARALLSSRHYALCIHSAYGGIRAEVASRFCHVRAGMQTGLLTGLSYYEYVQLPMIARKICSVREPHISCAILLCRRHTGEPVSPERVGYLATVGQSICSQAYACRVTSLLSVPSEVRSRQGTTYRSVAPLTLNTSEHEATERGSDVSEWGGVTIVVLTSGGGEQGRPTDRPTDRPTVRFKLCRGTPSCRDAPAHDCRRHRSRARCPCASAAAGTEKKTNIDCAMERITYTLDFAGSTPPSTRQYV
ncbi:hypothetical protein C8Q76DRAFT_134196 [Earliella scabrosa]|nr:hypothetical protein C8Q76DRAFT_134196 [Earliella scabrosa]